MSQTQPSWVRIPIFNVNKLTWKRTHHVVHYPRHTENYGFSHFRFHNPFINVKNVKLSLYNRKHLPRILLQIKRLNYLRKSVEHMVSVAEQEPEPDPPCAAPFRVERSRSRFFLLAGAESRQFFGKQKGKHCFCINHDLRAIYKGIHDPKKDVC